MLLLYYPKWQIARENRIYVQDEALNYGGAESRLKSRVRTARTSTCPARRSECHSVTGPWTSDAIKQARKKGWSTEEINAPGNFVPLWDEVQESQ